MFNKILIAILGIILAVFLFYWFQIRPAKIRNHCTNFAVNKVAQKEFEAKGIFAVQKQEVFDYHYNACIKAQGISR